MGDLASSPHLRPSAISPHRAIYVLRGPSLPPPADYPPLPPFAAGLPKKSNRLISGSSDRAILLPMKRSLAARPSRPVPPSTLLAGRPPAPLPCRLLPSTASDLPQWPQGSRIEPD